MTFAEPATYEAYRLLHEGAIAYAQMEENGVKVDEEHLDATIAETAAKIKTLEAGLRSDRIFDLWRRRHGEKTNLWARDQLAAILYAPKDNGGLGYECKAFTATDKPKMDEAFLEQIDLPFIKDYIALQKLDKLQSTYFNGIRKELVKGRVHPNYNLNLAVTYRPSCDHPNFQNIPKRNPEIAELIRRCYVSSGPDWHLVEMDFSTIEVRIGACYHQDRRMIDYIRDKSKDMHRDMAELLFLLPQKLITKPIRNAAKGAFVFAEFYGDWYKSCAQGLWHAMHRDHLTLPDDTPLVEHLREEGISELGPCLFDEDPEPGTFEHLVQGVERELWDVKFPDYRDWKKSFYRNYKEAGRFKTMTGFVLEGVFGKNDVSNYPIQGSAFHCQLWSQIKLQRLLNARGMRSKIVGQIYDSLIGDIPTEELPTFIRLARRVMTEQLPAAWQWIITPLEVEAEVAPAGKSWYETKAWTEK